MPENQPGGTITELLRQRRSGDRRPDAELMEIVYPELHRIAAAYFRREQPGNTLSPTAVVNEAYIRLVAASDNEWGNRKCFFAFAAKIMRHILVDHVRNQASNKRGGEHVTIALDEVIAHQLGDRPIHKPHPALASESSVLDIDTALTNLAKRSQLQSQIVELHFFGGLAFPEIAHELRISESSVFRQWRIARAWLANQLDKAGYG